MDGVLTATGVAQRHQGQIGQPELVIELAHHQATTVGTDLRAPELEPHPAVEIDQITLIRTRTLWVIREMRPSMTSTLWLIW